MELIRYRKTLDVHKNGNQFLLQGFETADNLSRVIEISLMASGDAIDFPLEKIEALMYVTTPNATEPSINKCTIKDNKIVYEVLPIVEEGITTMQLKLIETSTDGATAILASPKFEVEVTKSDADDSGAVQTTTFTALEDAMAKAKATYDERFLRMELTSDCVFKAYYADGTIYETDLLKKLFYNGNVLLSESYAHGGTGVRAGEDTDNSMYYSNVSKSESDNARAMYEIGKEVLEETKLHGVYTAFSVDFETGEVEYVSPSFKFSIDKESGHLDAEGQSYSFEEEVFRVVDNWLAENGYVLANITKTIETHAEGISALHEKDSSLGGDIANTNARIDATNTRLVTLENRVTPIALGGTGATNGAEAIKNLGIDEYQKPWNVTGTLGVINAFSSTLALSIPTSDQGIFKTASLEIPMINSGDIYLTISTFSSDEYFTFDDETLCPCFIIEKNDEEVYKATALNKANDWSNFIEFCKKPHLISGIKKGDVIRVTIGGTNRSSINRASIELKHINLFANADTAYKYVSLTPEKGNGDSGTFDKINILDILLGVEEDETE